MIPVGYMAKWLFNFLKTRVPAYPAWDQPTQNLGSRFPNAKNYVCLAFLIMSLQATAQIQNGEITGVIATLRAARTIPIGEACLTERDTPRSRLTIPPRMTLLTIRFVIPDEGTAHGGACRWLWLFSQRSCGLSCTHRESCRAP